MKRRRYFTEQKVRIIRGLLEKNISVPDICEKYRIHPNQFYCWKKELFEGAVETFTKKRRKRSEKDKVTKWKSRKHHKNQHNGVIPKSHWILRWEREAIIEYRYLHLEEGYRRHRYMMLDEDVVAGFNIIEDKKFMLSPVGLPFEHKLEKIVRSIGFQFLLANQFIIGQKL